MKCPKCGYHSFEHLESCKKCGGDLTEHKAKFNLRGFFFPGQAESQADPAQESVATGPAADEGEVDFGFDFLDDDEAPREENRSGQAGSDASLADAFDEADTFAREENSAEISLDDDTDELNLEQPFGIDGESVPADDPDAPGSKKEPGSEFSF